MQLEKENNPQVGREKRVEVSGDFLHSDGTRGEKSQLKYNCR